MSAWESQRCSWRTGGVSGMPEGVFNCLGVFLGGLRGVFLLSKVSGSVFYSNPINIHSALIISVTFSKRCGGPICLKYQNVPTLRSF